MNRPITNRLLRRRERGAVLIYVAVALIGLLAFSALAIDMGVLMVGRRQTQNAADAGALSAAISLVFGLAPINYSNMNDPAYTQAKSDGATVAQSNLVWGNAPVVNPVTDVQIIDCPEPIPTLPDKCVRVDAYRNQAAGNPLPTFFAGLVGIQQQGARATATAQVFYGKAASCFKPWAIPDLWLDNYDSTTPVSSPLGGTPTLDDTFDYKYTSGSNQGQLYPNHDVYVPFSRDASTGAIYGTGYSAMAARQQAGVAGGENIIGRFIILKSGNPSTAIQPGWFFPIVLPNGCGGGPSTGGSCYRTNIATCNPTELDLTTNFQFTAVEPGNMIGPTQQGVGDLLAADQNSTFTCTYGATWSCSLVNNCGNNCQDGHSPRLVAVPIFNPEEYIDNDLMGRFQLHLMDAIGVWVDGLYQNLSPALQAELARQNPGYTPNSQDVVGRFYTLPATGASRNGPSSFLRTIVLVR